jgi:hypothetical protein
VHVEERGGASLTGRQRLHVVAEERVQERRAIAAGHFDNALGRAIDDGDGAPGGEVFRAHVAVGHGQLAIGDDVERRACRGMPIVKGKALGHRPHSTCAVKRSRDQGVRSSLEFATPLR